MSLLDFVHFPEDKKCYHKISLCDTKTGKLYTDLMELHILELRKLPRKARNEDSITRWMRFFNGKTREDFREMAESDKYIHEAFSELEKLSADERKRLEYEAREKAVRDYNCLMDSAQELGLEQGLAQGLEQGLQQGIKQGLEQGLAQGLEQGMEQDWSRGWHKVWSRAWNRDWSRGWHKVWSRAWNRDWSRGWHKVWNRAWNRDFGKKQKNILKKCYAAGCLLMRSQICWARTRR